jgi:hypothetical protein
VIDLVSDDEDSVMIVDDDDDTPQVSFFLPSFFHSLVCSSDYNLFKFFLG